MPTQKIDPKVIFASNAPAIDKPPVFSDKTKGWDVARVNDGRPEIKQMNKMQQDTDLKILWLNENAVLPYDSSIDYPNGAVTIKDGSFKQLSSGSWIEFLDNFADKDAVKRGIANRYDSSLTYNSGERVILTNGDIVKSTINGNSTDPNVNMTGWDFVGKTISSVQGLFLISPVREGLEVRVTDPLRGGLFTYNESRSAENNGGTVFNGWVRNYFGSVHLDWFCETDSKTTDCSIYMERALAVNKGVKCSGREFLFTGRVGIPDVVDPLVGNEQSIYANRKITITGDGDTVFKIDCSAHSRATFTSATAKANPTTANDSHVGKVLFKDINFTGVNTTGGFDLTEANKNTIDSVFDGDRIYNSGATGCNFTHLRSVLKCEVGRGSLEGGNAYSQSFYMLDNDFFHNLFLVEADELINFRFNFNRCEKNYGGIKAHSKADGIPSIAVGSIDYNVFEAGGMFLDCVGSWCGVSCWNNYFEYNILEKVTTELCQIFIAGDVEGGVIGANNFGGQIDFVGYNTEYMDIKITGSVIDDSIGADVTKSKPVLIGNRTTSRQLTSRSQALEFGNATPYTLYNGWQQSPDGQGYFNSMNLHLPTENDVSFSRGVFHQPISYTANAVNGTPTSTLNSNNELIVAILDLSRLEGQSARNSISTITGEIDVNLELISTSLTTANASAKIHIGIYATGKGLPASSQYNEVRVYANLVSIIQPYDIPIMPSQPSALMSKQFAEPSVSAIVEPLGGGYYAIRLTNYIGVAPAVFGNPTNVYSTLTWQANVGCRNEPLKFGANVSFKNKWW